MLQRTDNILHRCGQYVRVSDDEDGDGFTFGNKQQLRVVNYILLGATEFAAPHYPWKSRQFCYTTHAANAACG